MGLPGHRVSGKTLGIGFAIGVCAAVSLGALVCFFLRFLAKRKKTGEVREICSLPLRTHGSNTSPYMSDSNPRQHTPTYSVVINIFPFLKKQPHEEPSSSSHTRITKFTYKEVQKATNNFTNVIGKGAFGPVYKALLPNTAVAAVKVLSKNSKQGEKEFQNEVLLLGRLHHKNLLRLVGYCSEAGHRILAYDYMPNGSLAKRLYDEDCEVLNWNQRVSIAQDVAKGIEYLHNGAVPPVIHRDIKSSNILLDLFMVAKVSDFGLSKEVDSDVPTSGIKGTYGYVDPQYMSTNNLTCKSDVYSFGVLLFELIAGKSPGGGLMEFVEMMWMNAGGREDWLQILDPRLKGDCNLVELGHIALIATQCVEMESRKRPAMVEVVQALARLGPKSESSRFDFFKFASLRTLEAMDRMGKALSIRGPSRIEARG